MRRPRLLRRLKLQIFRWPTSILIAIGLIAAVPSLIIYFNTATSIRTADSTYMKPFVDKVNLVNIYADNLPLSHLAKRISYDAIGQESAKRPGGIVHCAKPSMYQDGNTGQIYHDYRVCSYSITSYYWLNSLDDMAFLAASQRLQSSGWVLTGTELNQPELPQPGKLTLLGNYLYTRPNGITATLSAINKSQLLGQTASTVGYPNWQFIHDSTSTHNYYTVVTVAYKVGLIGSSLVTP